MQKEKKKSNIKLYIEKFKELWANPRSRAAILLGFYGLFMLFVVGGVRTNLNSRPPKDETTNRVEKEEKVNFSELTNYEYNMKITKDTEVTLFQGKHYENTDFFVNIGNNNAYYVEGDIIYQLNNGIKEPLENSLYDINITKFTPAFISSLLESATLDYTTNYSTGIEKKNYILSVPAFMRAMFGTNVSSNEIITITITSNKKNVESVMIDFLGYEKMTMSGVTVMTMEITYQNIGGVSPFHID